MDNTTNKAVILALAFGQGWTINLPLKWQVEKMVAQTQGSEIYTQHDLGVILNMPVQILGIAQQRGKYMSTLAVIEQFAQMAKMLGYSHVKLIAAKQHMWRCYRDLKKVLPTVAIERVPVEVPYTPDTQTWVSSPLRWWFREIILRLLPWKIYKLLCGLKYRRST